MQTNKTMAVFKAIPREEALIYKLHKPHKLNNDGFYDKIYGVVDREVPIPDFNERQPTIPKERQFKVP